jgi:hypothetical protein
MRRLTNPKWFRIGIDGKWSQFDHLFATSVEGTDGNSTTSACGVEPYAHAKNQSTVGFASPDGFTEQCPGCLAWLEGAISE